MTLIAEFEISTLILRKVAQAASRLSVEQVYLSEAGATKLLFWAFTNDGEALDAGYFDVPREATLSAIAETLGISDQALLARLRRGQATLLRNTLANRGAT